VVGKVFVFSMMSLGASGAFLAVMKSQVTNVLAGVLTFYLVATAWQTVRRKAGVVGIFDWVGLMAAAAVGATQMTLGVEALLSPTGMKYDYPPAPYFIFGLVALLAAAGDIRMLVRAGVSGTARLARHLWRMCFALFIASASIFLARPQLFPAILKKTGVLFVLTVLPLVLMIFWLVRVRFAKVYRSQLNGNIPLDRVPRLRKPEYEQV
jgi:hypothetical protein